MNATSRRDEKCEKILKTFQCQKCRNLYATVSGLHCHLRTKHEMSHIRHEELTYEDEDRSDNEDEKPVVVVLKEGDLTAEEAQEMRKHQSPVEDEETEEDRRITFKKPTKRQCDIQSDLNVSSGKKQRKDGKKKQSPSKEVKNLSLLSFDDEEEDT